MTARGAFDGMRWIHAGRAGILSNVVSRILEIGPLPLIALTPPALVWAWGCAFERLAVGLERLDEAWRRMESR